MEPCLSSNHVHKLVLGDFRGLEIATPNENYSLAQIFNRIRRKRTLSETQDPISPFLLVRKPLKLPATLASVALQIRDVEVFRRARIAEQVAL
jgi:hypothetical protein